MHDNTIYVIYMSKNDTMYSLRSNWTIFREKQTQSHFLFPVMQNKLQDQAISLSHSGPF